jgi:hypothetical protein
MLWTEVLMKGLHPDLTVIIEAMNVLFGTGKALSALPMARLDPLAIKTAYRRKAFETHPDRAVITGEEVRVLEDRFRELSAAYDTAMDYLRRGGHVTWALSDSPWQGTRAGHGRAGSFSFSGLDANLSPSALYTGGMPQRRLLLGQYLYYMRVISRPSLGAALVWQKMGRPLIGQIALRWKWLSRDDIRAILSSRVEREKFCDAAERLGYIASYQSLTLLGRQRVIQPKLGQYFIEKGILDAAGVTRAVRELRRHNRKYDR